MPSHGENTADLKIIRESIQDFQISSAVTQNNLDAQKMHEHYMTFDDEHMKSRYASELRRIWNETTNNLDGTYLDTSNTGKYPLGSEAKEKADKENENLKAFVQLFDELLEDETPGSGLHTYGVASNTTGKYHGINAAEAVAWMAFGGLSGHEMTLTFINL